VAKPQFFFALPRQYSLTPCPRLAHAKDAAG
jgi:hypothetical protein